MPNPNATPTPITPPRVPLIDSRTGLIDRAWYMFFLSLMNAAMLVYEGDIGPNSESLLASYDAALQALAQNVDTQPLPVDLSAELTKQIEAAGLTDYANNLLSQIAEMQKQIDAINLLPLPIQGQLTNGTSILYGDGSGGFSNVSTGSGVSFVAGVLSATGSGGTITSVTATAPIASSGGFTPNISINTAYGDTVNPYAAKTANFVLAGPTSGAAAVPTFRALTTTDIPTLAYVTSVSGTSPVVSSGGTTPAISMPAATTSVSGYLTSTDWNTFNNKGSGTVTSVSVVSTNGFTGTVANSTTTPAITLTTSITGLLKGNGTAISAAVANTDYQGVIAPVTKTADFTVANGDIWYINNKPSATCVVTLPTASSWPGRMLTFKNMQAQLLNSASSNVVPIDSTTAGTTILLNVIGNWATMVSDGTNWVIMQNAANNNLLLE